MPVIFLDVVGERLRSRVLVFFDAISTSLVGDDMSYLLRFVKLANVVPASRSGLTGALSLSLSSVRTLLGGGGMASASASKGRIVIVEVEGDI